MKRATFILLIAALTLSSIGLVACGSKGGATTQEPAETLSAKLPSGDIGKWGVPIYPGSKYDEEYYVKGDQGQFLKDKPAVLESRIFTTSDKMDSVVAFYKEKMPASGWKDTGWIEGGGEMSVGSYEKNGGQEVAAIQIFYDDNKVTNIKIDWIYAK